MHLVTSLGLTIGLACLSGGAPVDPTDPVGPALTLTLQDRSIVLGPDGTLRPGPPPLEPVGAISPDGRHYAFRKGHPAARQTALWLTTVGPDGRPDTAHARLIGPGDSPVMDPSHPIWLPDSTALLVRSAGERGHRLLLVRTDGTQVTIAGAENDVAAFSVSAAGVLAWSRVIERRGKESWCEARCALTGDLLAGTAPSTLLVERALMFDLAVSPDGRWLAWSEPGALVFTATGLPIPFGAVEPGSGPRERRVELASIDQAMWNDLAAHLAWHPVEYAVAGRFIFAGGTFFSSSARPREISRIAIVDVRHLLRPRWDTPPAPIAPPVGIHPVDGLVTDLSWADATAAPR